MNNIKTKVDLVIDSIDRLKKEYDIELSPSVISFIQDYVGRSLYVKEGLLSGYFDISMIYIFSYEELSYIEDITHNINETNSSTIFVPFARDDFENLFCLKYVEKQFKGVVFLYDNDKEKLLLADTFESFLHYVDWIQEIEKQPAGVRSLPLNVFKKELERYIQIYKGRNLEDDDKRPRATENRPYRFCVQDVIFSIWTMRHRKDEEDIFVEVFLTSEVYKAPSADQNLQDQEAEDGEYLNLSTVPETGYYDKYAGATAAMLTILSEAYRVGIPLRVQFGPVVENGQIPFDVYRLALRHKIVLRNAGPAREGITPGLIEPDEGCRLYLALSGFSAKFTQKIQRLHEEGLISMERIAYMVHHGVWSIPEVEGIVECSAYPEVVLSGEVYPEYRHVYQYVLTQYRMALMGGMLDRALAARDEKTEPETDDGGNSNDPTQKQDARLNRVEDDERNLEISTEGKWNARLYRLISTPRANGSASQTDETLPLPKWECDEVCLQPGELLSVFLRPRYASDLDRFLKGDLFAACRRLKEEPFPKVSAVVVPFDFHDLPEERQRHFRTLARSLDVVLMVCPETAKSFDERADKKMADCRMKKDN